MSKLRINTTLNYSPNFDSKKRKLDQIKFIIFHYTGMRKEKEAIKEFRKETLLGNQELYISRLKKLKKSSKEERDIFLWREKHAKEKNLPPSHIFEDKFLKKITKKIKDRELSDIFKLFKDNSSAKDFLKFLEL